MFRIVKQGQAAAPVSVSLSTGQLSDTASGTLWSIYGMYSGGIVKTHTQCTSHTLIIGATIYTTSVEFVSPCFH